VSSTIPPNGFKRGDVVWVNLGKRRPAVVVSADIINTIGEIVIIVPLTSKKPGWASRPHEVMIPRSVENGLEVDSFAQPQLVTYISLSGGGIGPRIGNLEPVALGAITNQLMLTLGHIPSA